MMFGPSCLPKAGDLWTVTRAPWEAVAPPAGLTALNVEDRNDREDPCPDIPNPARFLRWRSRREAIGVDGPVKAQL